MNPGHPLPQQTSVLLQNHLLAHRNRSHRILSSSKTGFPLTAPRTIAPASREERMSNWKQRLERLFTAQIY